MAGPSAATNFLSPEDYARLLQQAEAENRAGLEMNQAPRHWTQALAGALNQGLSGYREGQARERYGATKAAGAQAMAALLRGDEGAFDAAMKIPGFEKQAMQYELGRPQREAAAFSLAQDKANAPLQRQLIEAKLRAANAPKSPKWVKLGTDAQGQELYGTMDAAGNITPYNVPGIEPNRLPEFAGPVGPGDIAPPPPQLTGSARAKYYEESAKKLAASRIKAREGLPGIEKFALTQVPNLRAIMDNPDLWKTTSWMRFLPTTQDKTAGLERRMDQAENSTFLEGLGYLRGLGPATEFEGKAAQAAVARMSRAQSAQDYRSAMRDYLKAMRAGIKKGYQAAGMAVPSEIDALFADMEKKANSGGGGGASAAPTQATPPANDPLGIR